MAMPVEVGQTLERDDLLRELTKLQYARNNLDFPVAASPPIKYSNPFCSFR